MTAQEAADRVREWGKALTTCSRAKPARDIGLHLQSLARSIEVSTLEDWLAKEECEVWGLKATMTYLPWRDNAVVRISTAIPVDAAEALLHSPDVVAPLLAWLDENREKYDRGGTSY